MKNIPLLLGTILGSVALIFLIGYLFSRTPQTGPTSTVDRSLLESDLTNTRGATTSAKVTVVEFSDFQCPACRATEPMVAQLVGEFKEQAKFAYRHFPLESIHPNARAAALAAQAAAGQNAFWPFHDVLFEKQDEWAAESDADQLKGLFVSYAKTLSLDETKFISDLNNPDVEAQVNKDAALATQLKVNSTPSFFVNGVPTTSAKLRESIQAALAVQ